MPFAVTHILVPLIVMAIIRDFYLREKDKIKFSLNYVFIAGIAGILPDLDIVFYWILYFFGFTYQQVHKTISHSLFIPLILFLLFIIYNFKNKNSKITKNRNLKLSFVFLMLSFGIFSHIILDMIFEEPFNILYPLTNLSIGINLIAYLPADLQDLILPSLDAALLIIWLIYLQLKHKISDYI